MSATARLSVMMFLQYAVWGAWLPIAARYLGGGLEFSGDQIGLILGLAGSVGAVSAPFVAGQIADRWFRAERFLAVLLVAGGVVQMLLAKQTTYASWLGLSVLYSVLYMPTLALSNAIAFTHLEDRERGFPRVRVWGTIGWIAASWAFPMIWLQTDLSWRALPPFLAGPEVPDVTRQLSGALTFSALISFVYGAWCLLLPATPPRRDARDRLAFRRAFRLFTRPSLALLLVAALMVSIIHQIYFMQASPFLSARGLADSAIMPAMTVGQFSEIAVMALLGAMLARFGVRRVLVVGALAYFGRYAIWAVPDIGADLAVASLVLHGFCYACFFATAFIYVDRLAPEDVRHSAQTVFGIIILGGGPVLGGMLNGALDPLGFTTMFAILAGAGLLTAAIVGFWFRDETVPT